MPVKRDKYITLECAICGQPFRRLAREVRKTIHKGQRPVCSRKCYQNRREVEESPAKPPTKEAPREEVLIGETYQTRNGLTATTIAISPAEHEQEAPLIAYVSNGVKTETHRYTRDGYWLPIQDKYGQPVRVPHELDIVL